MFEKLLLRLRSVFRSSAVDEELDDEVRFHVEKQIEEFVRQGVPEKQAAILARRQFGNVTLHKEECRDKRHTAWLESIGQDLRHSVRTLRRSPGFTAVSILTLVVGIGATTAIFSVIDKALLNPVTAPDPGRLIWLQESSPAHSESGSNPPRIADWQTAHSFTALAGIYSEGLVWKSAAGPLRLTVLRIFGDLLGVLRPELQMGRGFTAKERRGEGPAVALLTAQAFRERFQSNPAILNRTIQLANGNYQVIGILGPRLNFPVEMDVWTPAPRAFDSRAAGFLSVVARLAPRISVVQAQAEINLLLTRFAKQYPATDAGRTASAVPLVDYVAKEARKSLLILFGAVGSVLLIGCLNIAGLLLARGLARRREAAIRVSVGAGYWRLARVFFAESFLLSLAGCVGGLLLAIAGVSVLKATLPAYVANLSTISVNLHAVVCAIGLSLLAALLFGGLPAWQFASHAQTAALKEGGAGTAAVSKNRLRSLLIVAEVAVSVVLITTAALLANSFLKVLNHPLGFNAAHAYTFAVDLPWDTSPGLITSLAGQTIDRMQSLPGTIACGVVDRLPVEGGTQSRPLVVRGKTLPPVLAEREFGFRTASPGFFAAAGIPVLAGGLYREGKELHDALISQRLAEILFPHENPLGHEIASRPNENGARKEPVWLRIVGVVGSVPVAGVTGEPAAELYVPWGQTYWPLLNFVVRTERPLGDVAQYVRNQIQPLAAEQVFSPVATLDERVAKGRSTPRIGTLLVGSFAVVALALSALGVFGLMSHETKRRTQEIGVRLALGAAPQSIAVDAVLRGVKLVTAGLLLGLAGAWYASAFVESLLFEVAPHDASSYVLSAFVLLAVGMTASLWPALRAARINPIQALRHE